MEKSVLRAQPPRQKPDWQIQLPLWTTLSRVLICPVLVALMYQKNPLANFIATALFILASLTDWLDGHLARRYQTESNLGKLLDPVADKIFVLTPMIILVHFQVIDPISVILLLGRDTMISGVRALAASRDIIIAAQTLGKWKTAFQMVALSCLIINAPILSLPLRQIGIACLWMSVGLSLISGYQYTRDYFRRAGV